MYNFNLMAGYTPQFLRKTKDVPLQLARQKYPRPSVEKVSWQLALSYVFLHYKCNSITGRGAGGAKGPLNFSIYLCDDIEVL